MIATREIVKGILRISDTSRDTYIDTMLPIIDGVVRDFCNNDFVDIDGNEDYPNGIELSVAYFLRDLMSKDDSSSAGKDSTGAPTETVGDIKYSSESFDRLKVKYFSQYRKLKW